MMRIAIVGAGAIGGFVAAVLARSGTPVAIVARGPHLDAIRRSGIAVVASDLGSFTASVEASDDLRALGPVDLALLAFKSHQWPALLPQLEAAARNGTTIVTLQNGVPFWFHRSPPLRTVDPGGRIGALFPDERVIGGVVHVSGHIAAPGQIHQSGGTRYVFGALHPASHDLLTDFAGHMRSAGLAAEIELNIRQIVWLKLVNNVGLNPVSTLRELTVHQLLAQPSTRAEVRALMVEALEVGRALGVVSDVDVDARIAYAQRLGDVRTSMLQDALAHRPLELDPIAGAVVELGEELGVPVPRLRAIYDQLRSRALA
jgi:2-dehydropantoate 2-reductase